MGVHLKQAKLGTYLASAGQHSAKLLGNVLMANASAGTFPTRNLWHCGLKTMLSCAVDGIIDMQLFILGCSVISYVHDFRKCPRTLVLLCMMILSFGRRLLDGY